MLSQKLQCIVLVMMLAVQHLACSLPLTSTTQSHLDADQKRNIDTSNPRQTLRQLEQIQRYYQHLYIRGLLRDSESTVLDRLQNVIDQLRHIIDASSN